jgi:hypothetical protein
MMDDPTSSHCDNITRYSVLAGLEASKLLHIPGNGTQGRIDRAAYAFWHAVKQFLVRAEASVSFSASQGAGLNDTLVASRASAMSDIIIVPERPKVAIRLALQKSLWQLERDRTNEKIGTPGPPQMAGYQ